MIRIFRGTEARDLPDDTPAMHHMAACEDVARCLPNAAQRLDDLADNGTAWVLLDAEPAIVAVETWREAAQRLTAERDEARDCMQRMREAVRSNSILAMRVAEQLAQEKAAAEKRLADLRAWAVAEIDECGRAPLEEAIVYGATVGALDEVVRRIDGGK